MPSHISIELLAAFVTFIYIKLANYTYPYFHSVSILIFFPACIANHLLPSYHSGNLEFSVPWISTGQESRPLSMHRNQFSHHYTLHQNNILRAKVEAAGIEPSTPPRNECGGGGLKEQIGQVTGASCPKWESLMAPSF